MAVTTVTYKPQIVHYGGAREDRETYTSNDTIAAGDLIRITLSGTIKLAGKDSDVGGPHGIALNAHAAATDIACPVVLFAPDTIIRVATSDSKTPADYEKGMLAALDSNSVTGKWAIGDTATKPVCIVTGYTSDGSPWDDATGSYDFADATENGPIDVRILTSQLDKVTAE